MRVLVAVVGLGYPLLVYAGLLFFEPRRRVELADDVLRVMMPVSLVAAVLVAYVLIGILLAAERVYRYWRVRGYHGHPLDPSFRRVFPPPAAGDRR